MSINLPTLTQDIKVGNTVFIDDGAIQLKVQLRYIRPPIWWRVVLPDNAILGDLHQVIQAAMGWHNCHVHSFRIDGLYYTRADASEMEDMHKTPSASTWTQ